MCTEADVKLVFLSFYSSNYNFIEQFFVILKQWMQWHENLVKKYKNNFEEFIQLTVKKYNSDKHSGTHFQSAHIEMNLTVTDNDYNYDYRL